MIIQSDCLEYLKGMKSNCVDTIITDPPYGLSFMGKKWDYDVPSIEIWKECLRVLKPGGTALIFAGSRTQHRMAVNVEDAGFDLFDTIMWLYGSGFPKSHNIAKAINKIDGVEFSEVPASGVGFMNDSDDGYNTTKNQLIQKGKSSDRAELWEGWGTQLKPAYEPIICARKPCEGSFANNALKYGVAGLNIDGGRIGTTDELKQQKAKGSNGGEAYGKYNLDEIYTPNLQGRFPANIILDEEAGKMLDEQSGVSKSCDTQRNRKGTSPMFGMPNDKTPEYSDKGGASRFFYCAKASKSERNAGCEELEEKNKVFNGQSSNPSKDMKGVEKKFTTMPSKNNHPTVKPMKLMEYLCTLTKTPTGGVVLDPFAGSGTTGVACVNTGRDFILIEREKEYINIINKRIEYAKNNKELKLF